MDIIETLNLIGGDILFVTVNESLEGVIGPSPGPAFPQWGNKRRKKLDCAHYPLSHSHLIDRGQDLLLWGVLCL